jgi:hypothetical protein
VNCSFDPISPFLMSAITLSNTWAFATVGLSVGFSSCPQAPKRTEHERIAATMETGTFAFISDLLFSMSIEIASA